MNILAYIITEVEMTNCLLFLILIIIYLDSLINTAIKKILLQNLKKVMQKEIIKWNLKTPQVKKCL